MRVKLSYTVKTEDVLREAAKILNLSGDDMAQAIALFNKVQEELKGNTSDDDVVNIKRVKEMMEEFRGALLSIDTRLMEVAEIVMGYDEYQHALDTAVDTISSSPRMPAPEDE
jgi:flagellin-specific chaperone FliS